MSAASIIVSILLILVALVLIVSVLMQEGSRQGLGTIGGGAETFFGKNKAKSYEGKLALITKIAAGVFIVLAIVMTRMTAVSNNASASSTDDLIVPTVEATAEADGEATEAPADEATEAPADEATEAPADEATEAPADEATEEPADEATEEPEETTQP